ncbi:type VII secretion protein EssB [Halobacillus litoralis]|uniref:type VII secretion protein EssB n=1 Tax=Halobacillus litoralis TaxID=45668 RepID=UPI001CD37138|nr:type VII secretion protein EssB [Halobacillus litoralis]MCA0970753.1 type VII secretion protein EssB [Halobacillus litoralis]
MMDTQPTYFRQITGADISRDDETYRVVYQKARLRMQDEREIHVLYDIDPTMKKSIDSTEDEVELTVEAPDHYLPYASVKHKSEYSRWMFADQLIKMVEHHRFTRLNLLICPENILVDPGMTPHFIHYGVKESLPPYEPDSDRVFEELKAAVAEMIDLSESFVYYLKFRETMSVADEVKAILLSEDLDTLKAIVRRNIADLERRESELVKEPESKWRKRRNRLRASIAVTVPLIAVIVYAFFFVQPKQAALLDSHEAFLQQDYEQVIASLSDYKAENLSAASTYQLARAYIQDEMWLPERSITLETDEQYLHYWIHMGREEYQEAVTLAKSFEDLDLILFSLIEHLDQIKGANLPAEEKEQELERIQAEIEEYEREKEDQLEEQRKQQEEQQGA